VTEVLATGSQLHNFSAKTKSGSAIVNGYIYVIGGGDGSVNSTSTTYYISTARVRIGGNLDLLGLQGQTIASGSGDLSLGRQADRFLPVTVSSQAASRLSVRAT